MLHEGIILKWKNTSTCTTHIIRIEIVIIIFAAIFGIFVVPFTAIISPIFCSISRVLTITYKSFMRYVVITDKRNLKKRGRIYKLKAEIYFSTFLLQKSFHEMPQQAEAIQGIGTYLDLRDMKLIWKIKSEKWVESISRSSKF